ncbi:hypothetical protein KSP40_PGU004541 [Platanthera guangdongensis]|uniref:Uncharacterized protein n=1 Tax=Platanthera guangdongensis TaxID=2320717 RepID=A0ABR2LXS6_9ASPA
MQMTTDKILVKKMKVNIFDRLAANGSDLLKGADAGSDVEKFGKIALAMGFSKKFFDSAAADETQQTNRRVLFETGNDQKKKKKRMLEKDEIHFDVTEVISKTKKKKRKCLGSSTENNAIDFIKMTKRKKKKLADSPVKIMVQKKLKNTFLDLGNNEIHPKGAFLVAEYIKRTKSLIWLNLYMNDMAMRGTESIAGALEQNHSISTIDFEVGSNNEIYLPHDMVSEPKACDPVQPTFALVSLFSSAAASFPSRGRDCFRNYFCDCFRTLARVGFSCASAFLQRVMIPSTLSMWAPLLFYTLCGSVCLHLDFSSRSSMSLHATSAQIHGFPSIRGGLAPRGGRTLPRSSLSWGARLSDAMEDTSVSPCLDSDNRKPWIFPARSLDRWNRISTVKAGDRPLLGTELLHRQRSPVFSSSVSGRSTHQFISASILTASFSFAG